MGKLIAQCFVLESRDYGVEPIIYLRRPVPHATNEKLHGFDNPFEAKAFIQTHLTTSVEITVSKQTFTQLALIGV